MAPVGLNIRHQYNEVSSDGFEDGVPLKPYNAVSVYSNHITPSDGGSDRHRRPFRRYYFRGLVGVLSPLLITGAFLAIWRVYVAPVGEEPAFVVGPPGANYIFYAWFAIGVVGLSLSLYGLLGVEAGILLSANSGARVPIDSKVPASRTWSGPSGWAKALNQAQGKGHQGQDVSILPLGAWLALTLPSILVFVVLPLSGLSFETTAGFVRRTAASAEGPDVEGFSYATFNERNFGDAFDSARTTWSNAMDARIPGMGVVYTPPGAESMPLSALPQKDGVSRVFLTAQAATPIDGTAWGLALQYNCSIVEKLSDLTVLRRGNESGPTEDSRGIARIFQDPSGETQLTMANQTGSFAYSTNLYGIVEFGYRSWPNASARAQLLEEDPDSTFTKTMGCYFNQAENITGDYPGIEEQTVFEMVLWQALVEHGFADPPPKYNTTVDHNMTELYGAYDYLQWKHVGGNFSIPMTAVGTRCVSSSSVGTARVDAAHSTFTDFQRTDTPINTQINRCAARFGAAGINSLLSTVVAQDFPSGKADWMDQLFGSVAAPPPFYAAYNTDPLDAGTGAMLQLSYLQASQLRDSLLRAHAAYAVQLVYNGGKGFTALDGSHISSANPNVTALRKGTVLQEGVVPIYVPAALFIVWALIAVVLSGMYSFRRRWADTVDEAARSSKI